MEEIVDLQMKEIEQRLDEYGLLVELMPAARTWLAKQGYDPAFGARPLKRALPKHVESPLSVKMLRGDFNDGDKVRVDASKENGLEFTWEAAPEPEPVPAEDTVDAASAAA